MHTTGIQMHSQQAPCVPNLIITRCCLYAVHQVAEHDYNFDGKPDAITFEASMSAPFAIHSIKALLQFRYSFEVSGRFYSLQQLLQ
jgi:hypothetical protein